MPSTESRLPAPRPDPETGEVTPWSDKQVVFAETFTHLPLVVDPDEWQLIIARRIVKAESIDAALEEWESIAFKDLPGRTVTIHSAVLSPSAKKSGAGWYALMDCTIEPVKGNPKAVAPEGGDFVCNTGAIKVLGQLDVAARDKAFPWRVAIRVTSSSQDADRSTVSLVAAPVAPEPFAD